MLKRFFIILLFILPCRLHARVAGQQKIDSLKKELLTGQYRYTNDTAKVKLLNSLSFALSPVNADEGLKYGFQGLALAEKLGWKYGIALLYNSLCHNYEMKSDYPTAIYYGYKAVAVNESLNNHAEIAANLGNIASCYLAQARQPEALACYFKALKLAEADSNRQLIALTTWGIGIVYFDMGDYDKSLGNYMLALGYFTRLGDKPNMAGCMSNIAQLYLQKKMYDEASSYYLSAVKLFEELGDKYGLMASYYVVGDIYSTRHNYSAGLDYIQHSLELSREIGNKEYLSFNLFKIAEIYFALIKERPAAQSAYLARVIDNAQQCIAVNDEMNNQHLSLKCHNLLLEAYRMSGNYAAALDHARQYISLKDTTTANDARLKIAGLETEREKSLRQKQMQINALLERQKRNDRIVFVSGLVLLLSLVIMILYNYRRQKRNNYSLAIANKDLAAANAKLAVSNTDLAEEKSKSDRLADDLRESIVHKDELTEKLELAASLKSTFLSNISHELRTPVTLFTGMLELMSKDASAYSAGDQQKIKVAYTNSLKLQQMVEELLYLSKQERGGQLPEANSLRTLSKQVKPLAPLLKQLISSFEALAGKQGLSLEYSEEQAARLYIQVDEQLFEKIINNLLYNAVKFSAPGGVIKVSVAPSADNAMAIVKVADTGKGITAQDMPYIFDRFYQGGDQPTADGLGIGLSLVKEFTQLHGGTVDVVSSPGAGTVFTLAFPLAEYMPLAAEAPDADMPLDARWNELNGRPVVMVVEDNAEMRYYLAETLGDKMDIIEAGNGNEALSLLAGNIPDLVITDIMMPGMDGRKLISAIKASEAYRNIPIITLSALADMESRLGVLRLGVDDYIVKPFHAQELRVRVYNLLHNRKERLLQGDTPDEPGDIQAGSREAEEFRQKITEYVITNMRNTSISVNDLAHELNLSERQLYRMAKLLTGCTPAQLVKEVRLQKAYELLLGGTVYKIEDVARRVGYENAGYFSKQFLERFGRRATELL